MRRDVFAPLTVVALAAALALGMAPDGGRLTFSGTLVVRHSDNFRKGVAQYSYWVESDGRAERLVFAGPGPRGLGGKRVTVAGTRTPQGIRVAAGGLRLFPSGPPPRSTQIAVGSYRLAVILLNFQNDQSRPWTPSQVDGIVFTGPGSMAAYYQEQSFGQTTVTGDVLGWYTIPSSSTSCNPDAWAQAAQAAAQTDGRDLSSYDHFMYVFPATVCSWSGLAYLPGTASWINGVLELRTIAHEFGHNLGVHHASSLSCTENGARVSLSAAANCSSSEYGDPFDVMGSGARHMSSFHKGQLGWAQAQTVTEDGTYALYPQETALGGTILRIPRGSTGWYLYLEFRRPFSVFDDFATTDPVVNGVSVRLARDYTPIVQSYLVDATPKTASFGDAALATGQSLYDPVSGVRVTTLGLSADYATVQVKLIGGPDLALTGTDSPDPIDFGRKLTYKLTALDNGPVDASGVQVEADLPGGATFVSASSSRGTCSGTGPVLCSLGSLANGTKATVTIVVKVASRGPLTASAWVSSVGTDPDPGDNTVTLTTTVK